MLLPTKHLNVRTFSMPILCDIAIESPEWHTIPGNWESILRTACMRTLDTVSLPPHIRTIEISLLLTDDTSIAHLNARYLGKNKPTNVLSFPNETLTPNHYNHLPDMFMPGDIVLAYGTIAKEALEQQKSFTDHMTHLTIHGMLHLLGYDHETAEEAEVMEALEISILRQFNIPSPYSEPLL